MEASDRIYVITSGTCNVIKQLIVIRRRINSKKYKFILPSEELLKKIESGHICDKNDTVERYNLVINQLGIGDVFNLGENLKDLLYVSNRKVSLDEIFVSCFKLLCHC